MKKNLYAFFYRETEKSGTAEGSSTVNAGSLPKYKNQFDLKLVKLMEYDALGYSIESLCEELAQMLTDMAPYARESVIQKLELSRLAKTPALAKVIEGCYRKLAQISANPHLLRPMPKPQFGSAKRLEEARVCRQLAPSASSRG